MSGLRQVEQSRWPDRLRSSGKQRDEAIEELRVYLMRGVGRALRQRYGGLLQPDDVVQLALIKILASLERFENRSRFETWAMAIAIRLGISELRKRHYRDVSIDLSPGSEHSQIQIASASSGELEHADVRRRLLDCLQRLIDTRLSEKQRLAIRGSLAGLPVEEIAARMQSNRNAVYKLLHDARLKLRQALEADGFTADDLLALNS